VIGIFMYFSSFRGDILGISVAAVTEVHNSSVSSARVRNRALPNAAIS
jgi:hypothetical protein